MISSKSDVEAFLKQFKPKFDVWGIIFLERDKNNEALKMLGIVPKAREEIIRNIEVTDYVETITNTLYLGDMWVFGKDYDGTELYIKISLGKPSCKTICISFHIAEYPLNYALK